MAASCHVCDLQGPPSRHATKAAAPLPHLTFYILRPLRGEHARENSRFRNPSALPLGERVPEVRARVRGHFPRQRVADSGRWVLALSLCRPHSRTTSATCSAVNLKSIPSRITPPCVAEHLMGTRHGITILTHPLSLFRSTQLSGMIRNKD